MHHTYKAETVHFFRFELEDDIEAGDVYARRALDIRVENTQCLYLYLTVVDFVAHHDGMHEITCDSITIQARDYQGQHRYAFSLLGVGNLIGGAAQLVAREIVVDQAKADEYLRKWLERYFPDWDWETGRAKDKRSGA